MSKSMKNILITLAIIAIVFVAFSFKVIASYNNLVTLEQNLKKVESNIDTQLQRRSDLIPNLVSTVKGYASQEKEIFTEIAEARAKLGGAQTVRDKANADSELSSALSRLLVVVENYPDLKSNQNFKDLTVALEGTENRINIARQDYNAAVEIYNTTVRKFPNSIIASIFRFEEKEFYKATEGAKEVPKVDFSS